jgi:hypothetical protein
LEGETVGKESQEPLGCVEVRRDALTMKVAVQGRLKVFQQTFKLIKMHVQSRHVLDKQVSQLVVVHQSDKETKGFLFGHLCKIISTGNECVGFKLTLKSKGMIRKFMP